MSGRPSNLRIYNAYRQTLRNLRKAGPHRAGLRKQKARETVATRYRLPISEVKGIVKFFDVVNGVTHEHTAEYERVLVYRAEAEALLVAHGDSPACPQCGMIPEKPQDAVKVRVHPYSYEIEDQLVPYLSCFTCYQEAEWDV